MIIENKQSTVAYLCPACGCTVTSIVDAFKLSADMVKLKCTCGNSEMTVVKNSDGKVKITAPCVFCPNSHSVTVSKSILFERDLFAVSCPYSGISVSAVGAPDHVKAELARSELQIIDFLEKSGLTDLDFMKEDEVFTDPQVLEIITYVIRELDDEGKIECNCEDCTERNVDVEMTDEGLRVSCPHCGASKLIPTSSVIDAYDFIHAEKIVLE